MRKLNPFRFLTRLDRYIMSKFIGTYIYSIALIISIAIVFDVNENLSKFSTYGAPLKAIVFDYYKDLHEIVAIVQILCLTNRTFCAGAFGAPF